MVTGGSDTYQVMTSTELYVPSTGHWRIRSPLPSARQGLRAATVDNRVLVFGTGFGETINDMSYPSLLFITMVCTQGIWGPVYWSLTLSATHSQKLVTSVRTTGHILQFQSSSSVITWNGVCRDEKTARTIVH